MMIMVGLGLMLTSALFHYIAQYLHITIHIREVCVFLAPMFSSFTVIVTYLLTKELKVPGIHVHARAHTRMHRVTARVCARRR
jgi:hypothetical protein